MIGLQNITVLQSIQNIITLIHSKCKYAQCRVEILIIAGSLIIIIIFFNHLSKIENFIRVTCSICVKNIEFKINHRRNQNRKKRVRGCRFAVQ